MGDPDEQSPRTLLSQRLLYKILVDIARKFHCESSYVTVMNGKRFPIKGGGHLTLSHSFSFNLSDLAFKLSDLYLKVIFCIHLRLFHKIEFNNRRHPVV